MRNKRPTSITPAKTRINLLALTPGDPGGIGPEITAKLLRRKAFPKNFRPVIIGAEAGFKPFKIPFTTVSEAEIRDPVLLHQKLALGRPLLLGAPSERPPGYQAGWSVEAAVRLIQDGPLKALVTGPIHKERLQQGGYLFEGHTDLLAKLCAERNAPPVQVTMMLANEHLRVSLVTVHCALKNVSHRVTPISVSRAILQTAHYLIDQCGVSKPRIAICGLNPHAGEKGLFGNEEVLAIAEGLRTASTQLGPAVSLIGPLPADTLFALNHLKPKKHRFDAVVAMYHDQGLIPVKLLDFKRTVNLTLGLPIIRTSVDHGTGFDIVGKNLADPSSLIEAVRLAASLVARKERK